MTLTVTTRSKASQKTSATIIDLAEIEPDKLSLVKAFSNDDFLKFALPNFKKLHFKSRDRVASVVRYNYEGHYEKMGGVEEIYIAYQGLPSLFMQALHQAFTKHIPFTLSPEVVWYLICHEIAIHVKQNAEKYAHLFTQTPNKKQVIQIRDDSLVYGDPCNDWAGCIHLFVDPMKHFIGEERVNFFLPKLTTFTDESRTAILVSFMDMVSAHCEFEWLTRCGIPRIYVEGQEKDWQLLLQRTTELAETFKDLEGYFRDLLPVLDKISKAVNGQRDVAFWKSIYKIDGFSGGPFISGWITALFAYVATRQGPLLKREFDWRSLYRTQHLGSGYTMKKFPVHVSKVAAKWDYYGIEIPMFLASGVLGVDFKNQSLAPKLGYAVIEAVPTPVSTVSTACA